MKLDRRSLLRGAGSVAIGLPLLEEMTRAAPAGAQTTTGPERLVTVFFGLGLDPAWQRDLRGALEPYAGLADKMAMCSVELGQGSMGGAHCNTSTIVFVGERSSSVNIAGGPSIDQLLRREKDPTAGTLVSGIWWRRGACDAQAQRVYNGDGSPRPPMKRPSQVFEQVFGRVGDEPGSGSSDPDEAARRRELRLRRSVLDSVMDQVRSLSGRASPLGSDSKAKLDQHLQSIREIETQLAPAEAILDPVETPDGGSCGPSAPSDPSIGADYDRFTYGTGGAAPEIAWPDYQQVFRLHADLWVMALRCDAVRFGNLMFESAGGHTNLRGRYAALGRSTDFPGSSQHDSYFHGNQRDEAELYQHFAQSNIAYFLDRLNDASHLEPNGKTVLDNTTVVIGTEYGWNHSRSQAFHAVAGGDGRFRSGLFTDRKMNCIDFYNAVLLGHGIDAGIGAATNVESEGDGSVILA